jgi:hypothetical protein
MMISIRPTLFVALLLLSTACGGGDEHDGSAASDSAAAALPSVEEAAMREAQDRAQAADTTLTLRHDGIGALRVGMTAREAEAALGHFRTIAFDPTLQPDSMACGYGASERLPAGVQVMMEGARVVRVEVDSGSVATAEGARIGDTEARIQQLYPGRVTVQPHKYTDGHYLAVRPAEPSDTTHLIVFETDGRVVLHFRGGQKPQVEYVEGCA